MTTEKKLIQPKMGLLKLAEKLGNVSAACKVMGYSRDSSYRFQKLYSTGPCRMNFMLLLSERKYIPSLEEMQADIDQWISIYNTQSPHSKGFLLKLNNLPDRFAVCQPFKTYIDFFKL